MAFVSSSCRLPITFIAAALLSCAAASPGLASEARLFHLIQVEQLIGGVGGDTTAQAIQVRMRFGNQGDMGSAKIMAYDAAGLNPIVIRDMDSTVTNELAGTRVLLCSPGFSTATDPPAVPDFEFTSLIPSSYLPAGSITFENDAGSAIYWRFSWGGAGYTGPTDVALTNFKTTDSAPVWPTPLPSAATEALFFFAAPDSKGTNNAADYLATAGAATFINNANDGFEVQESTEVLPPIDGEEDPLVPITVELLQSRPNPAREHVRVPFRLSSHSEVRLDVYSVDGGLVRTVERGRLGPGLHEIDWDGRAGDGRDAAAGVYLYRLTAGERSAARTMRLVR